MALIAFGFLGFGRYEEVNYFWRETGQACRTELFPEAVVNIFQPDKYYAFCTPQVLNGDKLPELKKRVGGAIEVVPIPEGRSEEELWEIFDICTAQAAEGDEIILDITHGFRSLPMVIFVVAAYLRQIKQVVLKRIIYGAFEARDEKGNAPIFDLTLMVELLDWLYGLDAFSRHGDAGLLKELMERAHAKGKSNAEGKERPKSIKKAAFQLAELSLALHLSRPLEAMEKAGPLVELLDKVEGEVVQWAKPLQGVVGQLRQEVAPLVSAEPERVTKDNLKGQLALIEYCLAKGLYVQGLLLMREWVISLVMLLLSRGERLNDYGERAAVSDLLNEFTHGSASQTQFAKLPQGEEILSLWRRINLRNDLAHCGFREDAIKARRTQNKIEDLYSRLKEFLPLLEGEQG